METTTPAYKVSKDTAALLNLIREAHDFYSRAYDAYFAMYDSPEVKHDIAAQKIDAVLEHVNAITDILHREIKTRIEDSLGRTDNADEITI